MGHQNKTEYLGIALTPQLLEKLKEYANKNEMNKSEAIRDILNKTLNK